MSISAGLQADISFMQILKSLYYLTWEPKSMAKSAGNVFPTEFAQKSAGKSVGKTKNSSNDWAFYKESWS